MDYRLTTSTPVKNFPVFCSARTVWQDKINLTNPQKKGFIEITLNLESSNTRLRLRVFFNNCTTKVRDYLDESLERRSASRVQSNN